MAQPKDRLADYVEVPDRIRQFIEKYPEGSLQRKEWYMATFGEQQFVVYTSLAYRTPDDSRPGEGTAWEPFPGRTPYTRDSELMNAETSSWGRALVALGFVGKKIASKEEVQNRQAARTLNCIPDAFREELVGMAHRLVEDGTRTSKQIALLTNTLGAHGESITERIGSLSEEQGEVLKQQFVDAFAKAEKAA